MNIDEKLIYETKKLLLVRYPRFGSEVAKANIEYRTDLKYHTAAADGRNVYIDPEYFKNLSEDERLFVIAHEIMHNKFFHMYRLKDSNGVMRDLNIWNEATDAIINANLERDGFTIKKGYVNRPEAINYTAEEFYEILLKEREEKQKNNKKNSNRQNEDKQDEKSKSGQKGKKNEQGQNGNAEEKFRDDHSMWEEAFRERENGSKNNKEHEKDINKSKENSEKNSEQTSDDIKFEFDERSEFEQNREERMERAKKRFDKTKRKIRGEQILEETIDLGRIGKSRNEIDWKLLLRREVERSETIWSQRRSIAENNYAYRLEEIDVEEESETEVMIDVSGSVDLELVKAFLKELKPLIKQTKLKVGCFNERFWGFVDVRTIKDIDSFTIPRAARSMEYAWTEDWDLAVRSFSKKRETNKIVFTDGDPCPGRMPREDLKRENVIWMVYGNKNFKPCCGRVINITGKQLGKLCQLHHEQEIR